MWIYKVYYSDDEYVDKAITLIAKDPEIAAKRYFAIYPREYNSQLIVIQKSLFKKAEIVFSLNQLFPDKTFSDFEPEIHSSKKEFEYCVRFDKSKLEKEDLKLLEEILKRHPDWLQYTSNHPESDAHFNIEIPCPIDDNLSIWINNCGEGPYVYFGPDHFDFYSLRSMVGASWGTWMGKWKHSEFSLHVDAIDTVVEKIMKEELIAMTWKGRIKASGFVNPIEFNRYLEKGKVLVSVSWLGTYNNNYNGEWADPFPE